VHADCLKDRGDGPGEGEIIYLEAFGAGLAEIADRGQASIMRLIAAAS
jgi:hypothetical protein